MQQGPTGAMELDILTPYRMDVVKLSSRVDCYSIIGAISVLVGPQILRYSCDDALEFRQSSQNISAESVPFFQSNPHIVTAV